MNIAVITPTIGTDYLPQAMHSVGNNAEHWIVVDGIAYAQRVASMVQAHPYKQKFVVLPDNTSTPLQAFNGSAYNGFFNGYRINAAIPLLINKDYIMFLDEDNWFEPNHIHSMIDALENNKWDWCYSLRRLVDKDGVDIMNDDCDSLGIYPNYEDINFVDMNCYLFKTSVLMQIAHTMIDLKYPPIGDKKLYKEASIKFPNFGCTNKYSVNYRLTRPDQFGYFMRGNKLTREKYQGEFPWNKN
jgi:hypothetical protein